MQIRPEVLKGAALLDEIRPGWEFEIDLGSFNLAEPCLCLLGQLYGDFYKKASAMWPYSKGIFAPWLEVLAHGFSAVHHWQWQVLQAEWVALIQARRAAADAEKSLLFDPPVSEEQVSRVAVER